MTKNMLSDLRKATDKVMSSVSTQEKLDALLTAFQLFTQETHRLEGAYQKLQHQFNSVNQELEQANTHLREKVSELDILSNYLNNILSNMSQGLIFIGLDGMITTYNEAAQVYLGVSKEEALFDTFWNVFPDTIFGFSIQNALSERKAPKSSQFNWPKEGAQKRDLEVETQFVLANDQDVETLNLNPAHDYTGGLIFLIRDITELNRLELIAKRNDRMKVLGEMAAMVAHEIRNPLGGIKGFASLLTRDLKDQPKEHEMAMHIVQGTDNLNKLLTNILNYVRPLQLDLKSVEIRELIQEMVEDLHHDSSFSKDVKIYESFGQEALFVEVDIQLLTSAILNLIWNAAQAMPEGGEIKLKCSKEEGNMMIQVIDEGEGIPKQNYEKIFRPFFTTKSHGNGFGLSETYRVVTEHNGTIDFTSEVNRGTTFTIKIPLKQELTPCP